jgi:hypothetical protein
MEAIYSSETLVTTDMTTRSNSLEEHSLYHVKTVYVEHMTCFMRALFIACVTTMNPLYFLTSLKRMPAISDTK